MMTVESIKAARQDPHWTRARGMAGLPGTLMRLACFGLVLLMLSVSGCSHPVPKIDREMTFSPHVAYAAPGSASGLASVPDWLSHFDDPQLTRLVSVSLQFNYDLQLAAIRIDGARASAMLAGAQRRPSIELGATARKSENPVSVMGRVETVESSHYGLTFNAGWELDLWGRLKDRANAAVKDVQAAEADFEAARVSLAGQVAKAWYQVIADELQLNLVRNTLDNYQIHARLVQNRFESGIAGALDLRLALSNVAVAEDLLYIRADQARQSRQHLQLLLPDYPDGDVTAPDRLPEAKQKLPAGLPSQLLERRPDVHAARQRLMAADLRIAEARKDFFPKIRLTGDLGTSSEELKDLLTADHKLWNLFANFTQPLFQGGRLKAGLSLAQAEARQAWIRFGKTVLTAFYEVEKTLAADYFLANRIIAVQTAVDQAIGAEMLALQDYAAGVADIVTVLEAQRRVLTSKADLIRARRQQLQNRVDIFLAIGGRLTLPAEAS